MNVVNNHSLTTGYQLVSNPTSGFNNLIKPLDIKGIMQKISKFAYYSFQNFPKRELDNSCF